MLPSQGGPAPGEPEPLELEDGPLPGEPEPLSTVNGPELGFPSPVAGDAPHGANDYVGASEPWPSPEEDPSAGTARLVPPEAALGAAVVAPEPEDAAPAADRPRNAAQEPPLVPPEEEDVSLPPPLPAEPQPVVAAPESAMPIGRADDGTAPDGEPAEKLRRPWEEPRRRSTALEMIAREANAHTRRAFELAGRGACFSARSEFIMALRLVAQGLDTEGRTSVHSEALAQGLTALREAEDFLPGGSRLEADLDMPGIIAGHRTPVLKGFSLDGITPLVAVQRYFTFAQEQLAVAAAEEVAGSMALQGLGKLHAALADDRTAGLKGAEPKAIVFYQAALLVYPLNYMASNDLGVLLARAGHYGEARIALVHSLSVQPHAVAWRNLAVVYRQLGQMDLALRAAQRWQSLRNRELAGAAKAPSQPSPEVRWVTPEGFARSYAQTPDPVRTAPEAARPAAAAGRGEPGARQAANRTPPSRGAHFRN